MSEIQRSFIFQLQYYAQVFNDTTINSFRARIFETEKDFIKYAKTKADFNPNRMHSLAFYSHDLKEMVLHKEIDDFSKTFAHELSHAILHYYCERADTWLNEGLAECFEDIVYLDSAYYFDTTQADEILRTRSFLIEGASIDEPVYTRDFYDTYQSTKNYTLSWAIVRYLYQTKHDMLMRVIRENCNSGFATLDRNYPGGLELLKTDVRSYYLNFDPSLK